MKITHSLLCVCSMPALALSITVCPTHVAAQEQRASAAPESGAQLQDVVVTATRDKTLLSRTPIAMSAITGDQLRTAGILGPNDLSDVAPAISIDHTDGLQVTIRGVSSNDQTEKGDPSAAFMLDGVYIARTQEADVSFFDVDRVEVLRGPQGTLYGKNTTAGVVNVITNQPELDELESSVDVSYGNYNAVTTQAMLNVPVNSVVALRAAIDYDRHDDYFKRAPDDNTDVGPERNNAAGRFQLLIKPDNDLSVLLRGEYAKLQGNQGSIASYLAGLPLSNFYKTVNGQPVWANNGVSAELTRGAVIPAEPGILGNGSASVGVNNEAYAFEGQVDWNTGPVTLTNIASYRHFARNETNVYDRSATTAIPDSINHRYQQFSNELRLSTNGQGPLHLQAGLYYFHETEDIDLNIFNLFGGPGSSKYVFAFLQSPVINRSWAGFSQLVYKPSEKLRITTGVRYTNDYKYRYGHVLEVPSVDTPLSQNAGYVEDASLKASRLTWRAGVDADVPGGLAYASVATGYKAGGFGDGCSTGAPGQSNVTSQGERCVYGQPYQPGASPQPEAIYYKPETLTAYEIGYKGRFADGKVHVDADVFHYDYRNLQLTGAVNINGAPSLVTVNAGKAKVDGAEIEAIVMPYEYNRLEVGLDLLDAHYTQYCAHSVTTVTPYVCDDNWAGRHVDRAPVTTVRAAYMLDIPMGDGLVEATVRTRFMSQYYVTAFTTYPIQYATPSHTTTDITLGYSARDDRWYVQAYAMNLENFITVDGVNTHGIVTAFGDPRTFGMRAGYRFGAQ